MAANVQITQVLLKRGNTARSQNYTGVRSEVTHDTGTAGNGPHTLRIHDGQTPGGTVIASQNWVNQTIANAALGNVDLSSYATITYVNNAVANVAGNYGNANVKSYLSTFNGNIVPSANSVYSLGSATNQWKDLWVSNATIYLNSVPLSIDTAGNLTFDGNPLVSYINGNLSVGDTNIAVNSIDTASVVNGNLIINLADGTVLNAGNVVGPQGNPGAKGDKGDPGMNGQDGAPGRDGVDGAPGQNGLNGTNGTNGLNGSKGDKGDTGDQGVSITLQGTKALIADLPAAPVNPNDFAGHGWIVTEGGGNLWFWNLTDQAWNNVGPIVGPKGDKGDSGDPGQKGDNGTNGQNGLDGRSAYELAVLGGFVGTQVEWLESLIGPAGQDGAPGPQGDPGPKGDKGDPGNSANTGIIAFDSYTTSAGIYNSQGGEVIISNFSYVTAEAETAFIQIPPGNSTNNLRIVQELGDVVLGAGDKAWGFATDGILTLPYNNYLETTDANLKVGSQGAVTIRSDAATVETTKAWTFDTSGNFIVPGHIHAEHGNDINISVFNPTIDGVPGGVALSLRNYDINTESRTTQFTLGAEDIELTTDFSGTQRKWTFNKLGHIVPGSDVLQDIGTPTNRVRHIYVGPGSITVGNSVITESTTGKLVLPGVTRATSLYADEVEDVADQTRTWTNGPYLLDAYHYGVTLGTITPDPSYSPADYTIDQIDGEGYIDGITIDPPGVWTQAVADYNRANRMYAYIGTNIQEPFNPANWVTIPFVVRAKANDVEYEFNTGGGNADLGDFSIDGSTLEAAEMTIKTNDGDITLDSDSDVFVNIRNNGEFTISDRNSETFKFEPTLGKITFPDGTEQTTAYTGGGGGNPFDQDLNTTNDVTFANVATTNLNFGQTTIGAPAPYGATDRITLFDFDGSNDLSGFYNYAIGVEPDHIWFANDYATDEGGFKFYGRGNLAAKIGSAGTITLGENSTGIFWSNGAPYSAGGSGGNSNRLVNGNKEAVLDENGNLDMPDGGQIWFSYGYIDQDTDRDDNALRVSGGNGVTIKAGEDTSTWRFNNDGSITFPDDTVQTTAYTGQSGGSSTVARQDTAPNAGNGTLWFNTIEGRLYIKYNDQWVDAAPLMMPAPDTDIDVNSITFADASTLTSAYTNKLVNGVHEVTLASNGVLRLADDLILPRTSRWIKDCEGDTGTTSMRWYNVPTDTQEVELFRVYSGEAPNEENTERAKISLEWQDTNVSGLSITSFDRTEGEIDHKWNFLGDGSLKFPGQSDYRIREDEPGLVVTSELGVAITTNSSGSAKNWIFTSNGTLMLPGAVVNSTLARTGGILETPMALDLTKTINKLADGFYSLADGVEGQIMYLVPQTGTNFGAITVTVANARILNDSGSTTASIYTDIYYYPFEPSSGNPTTNVITLIFTDGAWQASGGSFD